MSSKCNDQGRAYEFAWIQELVTFLSSKRATNLVNNSSLEANRNAWNSISANMQQRFRLSAHAAISTLLELEPHLAEDTGGVLQLEFQTDKAGVTGDVRDIVIKDYQLSWEIGLSVKHNHEAVKHSRLSKKLDFGREWYEVPCSSEYWNEVFPIFEQLTTYKQRGIKWCDLADKQESVYVPLLNAFKNEVLRTYESDTGLPLRIIEYLIGNNDYYKVISHDKRRLTLIRSFNIHGTLNQDASRTSSTIKVPQVELPTELIGLKFKKNSKSTLEMSFNNGWQLSFRIHSASTRVEPSLKFDIQFIEMPDSILNLECRWK